MNECSGNTQTALGIEEEMKVHGTALNQFDPDYNANTKNALTRNKLPQIKSGEVKNTEDLVLPG